jgi:hypothetical protein
MGSILDGMQLDLRAQGSKQAETETVFEEMAVVNIPRNQAQLAPVVGPIVAGAAVVFGLVFGAWIFVTKAEKRRGHARQWERAPQESLETEAT